ncbi:MAG TPA: DUF6600 domain-containing protein, partial [Kofleriaceae bacterium]|nr:DUF6600 domain-containing protein [Kofleriaceae bacterium]
MIRLVAVLSLILAGCYRDASTQATLPEPEYFAGPPGGAADPGTAYGPDENDPAGVAPQPGEDADESPVADEPQAPTEIAPPAAAPAPMAAAPEAEAPEAPEFDEGVAEAAPTPEPPADPTGSVNDSEIEAALDGYGQWIDTDDYGQVWRPDATVVGVDFTPYESGGSWQLTDAGWAFACDYPWGWLPFHYGRWAWFHDYWGWVPGHRWGPAWVEWRHGGGVVGWRPLRPRVVDHRAGHEHRF